MFRNTPGNLRKLRRLARELDAVILTPFYPASELFRVVNEEIRLAILSRRHEGASLRSIAQDVGVSVGTVHGVVTHGTQEASHRQRRSP